jgi:F0F1-type ATP synthase alpha subunit
MGLDKVQAGEMVEFLRCSGMALNLERDNVGIDLGQDQEIHEGDTVNERAHCEVPGRVF